MAKDGSAITDEKLAELRSWVGDYKPVRHAFITEITRDTVRHFVEGIGDTNPLFANAEYAKGTKYGGLIAPPTFLLAMIGQMRQGLPGVHNLWSGAEIECSRPIRAYEQVTVTTGVSAIEEKFGQFSGRMIYQEHTNFFRDKENGLIATLKTWGMRTERVAGREKGKYKDISLKRWTEEELKAVEPGMTPERFAQLDRNKDGVLTKEDRPAQTALGRQGQQQPLARLVQDADKDKDGKVTFEELKAVAPRTTPERFGQLDRNKDGVITAADKPAQTK